MATHSKGILGSFSGKLGTVVGGTWRGIPYMRSLPTISKNRKQSFAQEVQQAKFALAQNFLRNFGSLLNNSFQEVAGQTQRNEALAIVLNQAVGGTYPNLMIDYGMVLVSKGSLKKPVNPDVLSDQPGKIKFSWTDDTGSGNAKASDKAILVAYDEQFGDVIFVTDGATRSSGQAELDAGFFSGKPVHTWLGFISENGKLKSDSLYTGAVAVE
jgi:hypothetical protein